MEQMEKGEHSALFGSRAVFTFVQPTAKQKITYREQQARLRRAVARHKDLQEGCVLDTMEKGGEDERLKDTRNERKKEIIIDTCRVYSAYLENI
jgi:hypothetical protein